MLYTCMCVCVVLQLCMCRCRGLASRVVEESLYCFSNMCACVRVCVLSYKCACLDAVGWLHNGSVVMFSSLLTRGVAATLQHR